MYDSLRGSGRTTRMLKEVLGKAIEGTTLVVGGWRDHHCVYLFHQFVDLPEAGKVITTINFTRREVAVGSGRVLFRPCSYGDFNWPVRRFNAPYFQLPVYLDHHTVEMHEEEEAQRAFNAAKAARLAEGREEPQPRYPYWKDTIHTQIFPTVVASDPPVADQGAQGSVSCDVPSDAPASSDGSDSSGGSCGAD